MSMKIAGGGGENEIGPKARFGAGDQSFTSWKASIPAAGRHFGSSAIPTLKTWIFNFRLLRQFLQNSVYGSTIYSADQKPLFATVDLRIKRLQSIISFWGQLIDLHITMIITTAKTSGQDELNHLLWFTFRGFLCRMNEKFFPSQSLLLGGRLDYKFSFMDFCFFPSASIIKKSFGIIDNFDHSSTFRRKWLRVANYLPRSLQL